MKKIKNIVVYLANYKLETGLIIVFNLLANIFTVVSPPMLVPFLQILFQQTTKVRTRPAFALNEKYFINMFYYQMENIVKEHSAIQALVFLVCVIVTVFFLKNIFRYAGSFYMAKVRNGVVHDIQNQLYTKITELPLSFFSGERKGDLISKMTSDVKEVEYGILGFLDILFKDPILIILTLFTLFMISSKLCFFVFFMMGIIAAIIFLIGKTLKRQSHEGQKHIGIIISVIDETIGGIRIIRAFNTVRFMREKFFRINKAYEGTMNRVIRRRDLSSPLTEVLIIAVMCVILWYGGKMVLVTK
jgi:subfamily B ATP-binding cassette protein MsbA